MGIRRFVGGVRGFATVTEDIDLEETLERTALALEDFVLERAAEL
jgi:hypothetical protein